ncbi:N-acetylglucosamine-specific PTS transporter subunit IIBC [Vibrio sp. ZSDE26]|uniref:N-acetylglucosamine-specific PTS transporter subunit IIBC n=1 Tax=Vibrio amylolyticus TaxID=2847292 RepID=A0A9X1XJN5_9VIBR|nr:N-acetylglucosamine-specific PTS transporter subunit IIBC [Vibrio amylolyticus]MCK6264134.1 N-acetylglucosamine-specific PTS transporter subunit IIBC [Vibrio amylolyticus]
MFTYIQRLGKALMLPIATLPVAAMLLRFGQPDLLDIAFIAKAGGSIFDNLALIFAVGIAIGLSKDNSGAAALSGIVGYFILTEATVAINPDIKLGFFAGIISGIISGHAYNRFYQVTLPDFLAFFAGKRLTPIMSGLFCLVAAFVCGEVWPTIQAGIDAFSYWISESGPIGHFIYGIMNRGLIPLGLHYFLHSVFWFSLDECVRVSYEVASSLQFVCLNPDVVAPLSIGQALPDVHGSVITEISQNVARGDLNRFFSGDPNAGVYMAWAYPIMMGGLPGAALAFYVATEKAKRPLILGMLSSLALTSFLTGITEPLEFSFLFIAPALYAVHAVMSGIAMVVTNSLGILHGFGFSAGFIDFILNWGLATNAWMLLPLIGVFFVAYFVIFLTMIKVFKLPIPEAEESDSLESEASAEEVNVEAYVEALGGKQNIKSVDACITRLRLQVEDSSALNEERLKELGSKGVIKVGKSGAQVVLGPKAEVVATSLKAFLF